MFELTWAFLQNLGRLMLDIMPLLIGLGLIISAFSFVVGLKEKWSMPESLYFGFITALTVGYGDIRPTTALGRLLAVIIALVGLITTGIMIAVGVEAGSVTFDHRQAIGS
jgi:voltage-gated potassium channel